MRARLDVPVTGPTPSGNKNLPMASFSIFFLPKPAELDPHSSQVRSLKPNLSVSDISAVGSRFPNGFLAKISLWFDQSMIETFFFFFF